jgi:hypothetical protein
MGNDTTDKSFRELIAQVKNAAGFEPGFAQSDEFEDAQRDIIAHGYDAQRNLAVIGIHKSWRKKGFPHAEIRRVYSLVGISDEGTIFGHEIPSRMMGMGSPDVVRWAESKVFGLPVADLGKVIRKSHICLVPVEYRPEDALPVKSNTAVVPGGYQVKVEGLLYRKTDVLYADGFIDIVPTKSPQETLSCEGRFKILVGKLAGDPWWAAAARIGD